LLTIERMIKRIIFSITFLCVSMNTFSYAVQAPRKAVRSNKHTVVEPWKYGASFSTGLSSRRIGGFVEYKMEMIGVEAGLAWFGDRYFVADASLNTASKIGLINYSTFVVPLVLKLYPGSDRQFAIRAGLQVGYVIQNEIRSIMNFKDFENLKVEEIREMIAFGKVIWDGGFVNVSSVAASEDKVNDWYCGYIVGFEHETDFGFIWGFDFVDKLTSFIEAKKEINTFSLMLNLGMNLGVFFY
jgi:hypothetical protein